MVNPKRTKSQRISPNPQNTKLSTMSARQIAFQALQAWGMKERPLQDTLDELLSGEMIEAERALAKELCFGVMRRKLTLDEVIRQYAQKSLQKTLTSTMNILRLGLYQLLYLSKVPEHAAVNESVNLAKKFAPSSSSFVNALLRNFLRKNKKVQWPQNDPIKNLSLQASYPLELVKRWGELYGLEKAENLCEIENTPLSLSLRVNTLLIPREELIQKLQEEGIECKASALHASSIHIIKGAHLFETKSFQKGFFQIQDESMLQVIDAMELKTQMKVLDLCSAPGTKATAIAERMQDKGLIIAVDQNYKRLKKIFENLKRLNIHCVQPLVSDARKMSSTLKTTFDRILIDAPCSNTGVLNKRPEARWRFSLKDLHRLSTLQREILESALPLLKPEGILIYSTCSIDPIENEKVIESVLEKIPKLTKIEEKTIFPSLTHGGGYWAKLKMTNPLPQ